MNGKAPEDRMFIVGHRGGGAPAPENTLKSIRNGMRCAGWVEVDVRFTRDGIPVVIHDATLERTTNGRGNVRDHTLIKLKELDAGEGEQIPTLEEVLDCIAGRVGLFLELKETEGVEEVCAILGARGPSPLFLVSFHKEVLLRAKELLPEVRTGWIFSRMPEQLWPTVSRLHASAVLPRIDLLDRTIVGVAHGQHLKVVTWTLNREREIARAVALGVDGFATDDACRARGYLQQAFQHGGGSGSPEF